MTTEMQEIAITEEKPLLPGQPDPTKDVEAAARILLDQGQEHSIETPHGLLHVTLHGTSNTRRPAILTFHDVGLDSKSCFSPLFKFEEMQEIVKNFTLVHIDAPGQEEGATAYPMGYQYPSMEQIAEMIPAVLTYFNFRTVIGIGVGSGSYILSRFTMAHPDSVEGLVLINMDPETRGWMDWAAQKITTLTSSITEQILSHLFSQEEMSANADLVRSHRDRISKAPNLINIELFWRSYNSRRDLIIDRNSNFKCPVMLVVGDQAPHEEAAVECNSKLDPTTTSFLKMADAGGLPQLTQPSKLTEAFKYFIQGMGYMASSIMTRLSRSRTASLSSSYSMDGERQRSRTLSQSSQGGQMPPSPSHTMEVSC
ncbi:protein NDRG2 [Oncorhynchus nerka]|uniref:Protein NDRG2 n=1 Tax=Oncorhynchus kisutch TaxID=8019 RepID=A0A8C7IY02_ONCKI|nr:protein NDRG2-like [Oncorhynchus kisutch]XP_029530076.1 protein NDRG2-like [Oncorhynchus nerka]XP_029530077.1 protein NDRG2-like [Oncorhynchus nerka]XP_042185436.1 protein NDRG2-like [Oncorhynchus tshawytscha]